MPNPCTCWNGLCTCHRTIMNGIQEVKTATGRASLVGYYTIHGRIYRVYQENTLPVLGVALHDANGHLVEHSQDLIQTYEDRAEALRRFEKDLAERKAKETREAREAEEREAREREEEIWRIDSKMCGRDIDDTRSLLGVYSLTFKYARVAYDLGARCPK